MSDAILTLNAGSSSLKLALFARAGEAPLASGLVDRIGPQATLRLTDAAGTTLPAGPADLTTHDAALAAALAVLARAFPDQRIEAVGHRIVHGGPDHDRPARLTPALMAELEALVPLAPLHQPHNLAGVRAAMAAFPGAPQVACFDTAFHRSHPWVADTYALPREFYARGLRRYGFHGLSYDYIAGALAGRDPALAAGRVIVAHLGNGASMCALAAGRSVASTMGFTALDGLPMGTRPGQIDPGVILHLIGQEGMSVAEVTDLLYRRSGLLGLSGLSSDMRTLESAGTVEAREAIDYFTTRCQREIASLAASLDGVDALVFCGGIGENSRLIRAAICARLGWMGIAVDHALNAANAPRISPDGAPVQVLVIPTNEELVIARATRAAIGLQG